MDNETIISNVFIYTNMTAAIISFGVSAAFGLIYWFGGKVLTLYKERQTFKLYKEDLNDFLDRIIYYSDKEKIKLHDKEYALNELEVNYIAESGNKKEDANVSMIPSIILAFMEEERLWSMGYLGTFINVLGRFAKEDVFFPAKMNDDKNQKVKISGLCVHKGEFVLAYFSGNKIVRFSRALNKDKIEKIKIRLGQGSFDDRIKKIIKKIR